MNRAGNEERERLEELRREFDQSFARPPCEARELAPLIAIRAAGEALALEAGQISGLVKQRRVVPVPSRAAGLLGVAGIRGVLVPVYSLAALLGLPARAGEPQWLALANREAPVALAFDELEGRVEVPRASLQTGEGTPARHHIRRLASVWSSLRGVVDIPGIIEDIQKAAGLPGTAKEP